MSITAVVNTDTNEFLSQGHVPDSTHIVVTVPRNPSPRIEKYSGNPADPFTAKTQAEIDGWNAAKKDDRVEALIEDLTFRVLAKWIAQLHGLTPAQARQQLKTIVRGML